MKSKFLQVRKMLLVAAGLLVGASAWADVTPFSESYSSGSTTDGWSVPKGITDRYIPIILSEDDNYFLSVTQNQRNNNGTTVTGSILNGKASEGDDFTLMFDLRLASHSDAAQSQGPASFTIYGADNEVMLSLKDNGANSTTWVVNETSTNVMLPNSSSNASTDGTAITSITWCSFKVTRSGAYTYLTITNKSTEADILERTVIGGVSSTGGLGNIIFTSSRYNANFAIDNIVLRKIEVGDIPEAAPTTVTVKFQNGTGATLKADETINTIEGVSVSADDYAKDFTEDGQKYIYVSGNQTITANADASANVITLIFREATTWNYAIYAVDAESTQLQAVTEGTQFEGDSKTAYFPKAFNKDGVWYQTSSGANGASYYSFVLNETTKTKDVTYSVADDIDYYFECEDLDIVTKRDNGSVSERASNGATVRLGIGGYLYTTSLAGGIYTLRLNCNNPNSGNPVLDIMLWNGESLTATGKSITKAVASVSNYDEISATDIVVPEGMALALQNNTEWNSNASLDYIILKRTSEGVPAIIGSTGYTTFASNYALDLDELPEGVTAYYVSDVNGTSVVLEKATGTVEAGIGLILQGTANESYDIPVVASGTEISGNKLVGCPNGEENVQGEGLYVLVNNAGTAEFQQLDKNAANIPAGKAYLDMAEAAGARLSIVIAGETTGIAEVATAGAENGAVYNLSGQRVSKPANGLYIVNGKKVIIK